MKYALWQIQTYNLIFWPIKPQKPYPQGEIQSLCIN